MTKSEKTTLEINLADSDSESLGTLPVRIEVSDFAISIYPHGYGDCGSADGHGCPLSIEFHQGRLRVIAFPDINSEELRVIDLSGARENRRRDANGSNEMTPLQRGRKFHEFMDQINPTTGKTFTMKEAASAIGVEYGTFRRLVTLWRPPKMPD